jgi:hypothetical protein
MQANTVVFELLDQLSLSSSTDGLQFIDDLQSSTNSIDLEGKPMFKSILIFKDATSRTDPPLFIEAPVNLSERKAIHSIHRQKVFFSTSFSQIQFSKFTKKKTRPIKSQINKFSEEDQSRFSLNELLDQLRSGDEAKNISWDNIQWSSSDSQLQPVPIFVKTFSGTLIQLQVTEVSDVTNN